MKKAAIFYHGFLTDDKDFGRLYGEVENRYEKIVKFVFPGHKKPNDFSLYSAESSLENALKAFDELQAEGYEVDIYGFSMGGATATYIAKQRDVRRLVLLAPANKYLNITFVFSELSYQIRTIMKALDGSEKENARKALEDIKVYFKNDRTGWKIAFRQLFPNYTYHNLSNFARLIRECNRDLTEITPPTLIIWGELDQFVKRECVDYLGGMLKSEKSEIKIYPDLSHLMLYGENDGEVIDKIIDFLDKTE